MKKAMSMIVLTVISTVLTFAQIKEFETIPTRWKWLNNKEVAFTYNGLYNGSEDFSINAKNHKRKVGIDASEKYIDFPIKPNGAVNLTWSPDSTKLAYTKDNDLYFTEVATGEEKRLTFDGSQLILNGFASWVYYEEILGRPSKYKAFWWSPDSKTLAFYRFDNSSVPMFPIYSHKGQDGVLNQTRYPKTGEMNPTVRIGFASVASSEIVWADFNESEDQYFGIPFWGADSKEFFVSREPRLQNTLDLYSVCPMSGRKSHIYREQYKTWLDWIDGMLFTDKGLYMVRNFETGWQQIYFLSYDGKEFRRLTNGENWRIELLKVADGEVFFTANRESTVRKTLYKVNEKGQIKTLTDPAYTVDKVEFSPDGRYFVANISNFTTPNQVWLFDTDNGKGYKVADMAAEGFDASKYALAQNITMKTDDGFVLPAYIVYPKNFDDSKKYPVHFKIYGGPDSPLVKERWLHPDEDEQWWSENEIIHIVADCRAAGHNGREGMDMIYRQLGVVEAKDFVQWANYMKSLPFVDDEKIGIEGFSFGGTMTALLLLNHSDAFHYGIAGGGVYDWSFYDTHYAERYMDTPQNNQEGYELSRVANYVKNYPTEYSNTTGIEPVMLKLTHGTGDDNVHFQNTLLLLDALHREGKKFELMIYPDAMHGYKGYQGRHSDAADYEFWLKYLKGVQ